MTAVPEVLLGDFTAVQCRNWRSRARRSLGRLCRNDEYTASVLVTRDVGCRPYRIEDFRSPCGTNRREEVMEFEVWLPRRGLPARVE
jgi:hypothetical protein